MDLRSGHSPVSAHTSLIKIPCFYRIYGLILGGAAGKTQYLSGIDLIRIRNSIQCRQLAYCSAEPGGDSRKCISRPDCIFFWNRRRRSRFCGSFPIVFITIILITVSGNSRDFSCGSILPHSHTGDRRCRSILCKPEIIRQTSRIEHGPVIVQIGIIHWYISRGFNFFTESNSHICRQGFPDGNSVLGSVTDRIIFQIKSKRPGDLVLLCQGNAVLRFPDCHLGRIGIGKPVNPKGNGKPLTGCRILMEIWVNIILPVSAPETPFRGSPPGLEPQCEDFRN